MATGSYYLRCRKSQFGFIKTKATLVYLSAHTCTHKIHRTKSDKGLTGKLAALTIKSELPEFVLAGRVFVIKTEGILP